MSLSSALSIALTGLQVSTQQLQLAASNIANAQTPGYTEKSTSSAAIILGNDVGGVGLTGYARATDKAMTASLNNAASSSANLSTSYNYLTQVQSILGSNANNPPLSAAISNFQSAWTSLSSAPESTTAQQGVISAGTSLANIISSMSGQITSLNKQVQTDAQNSVTSLNSDLNQLQTVNTQIIAAQAAHQPIVDLQDQQDNIVKSIASITSVNVLQRGNGSIALYTPGGSVLLDNVAQVLSYSGAGVTNSSGQNVTSSLVGGSLQAQLNFIDTSPAAASSTDPGTGVIAKLQAQVAKVVDAFTNSSGTTPSAFATAYSSAVTASTASGANQYGDAVAATFFTVSNDGTGNPDPSTFKVNANLTSSAADLPQTSVNGISNSFIVTANYATSGLVANSVTYAQLGAAVLSTFQQSANSLQASSTNATSQQSYYQTNLSSETGVNVDAELVNLTTLQNTYAASAHVISTIQSLLTALENVVSG